MVYLGHYGGPQMIEKYYETDRLTLTLTNEELVVPISEYIRRNRDFLKPYETVNEIDYSKENLIKMISKDNLNYLSLTGLNLWIQKKGSRNIIGSVNLSGICISDDFSTALLGARLDKDEVRNGYAYEACEKCIDIAFTEFGIHRLVAMIMISNTPSIKAAQKLGFITEGIARDYAKINGKWEDHIQMILINPQDMRRSICR